MTEKIDIKEARLAVRGKFEDNGDPSWDDMCALVLETVCFAAETFADGTWDDLGEMLEEAVAFDESGENSLARMIDAWSGGLEARDFATPSSRRPTRPTARHIGNASHASAPNWRPPHASRGFCA